MVITFHTLSPTKRPTLAPQHSIPRLPDPILTVSIAVRDAIGAVDAVAFHLETAKVVHVAVSLAGGLVGGQDVAVVAVRAGVDGDAAGVVAVFGYGEGEEGQEGEERMEFHS